MLIVSATKTSSRGSILSTSYPIQGSRYRQDAGVSDQQLHLAGTLFEKLRLQQVLPGSEHKAEQINDCYQPNRFMF